MVTVGSVFAALAALLHVYIFVLESVLWTKPRARRVFGTTAEEAAATRELAFNQGFYNLFLAVVTGVGIIVLASTSTAAGGALIYAGMASMLLAAVVLLASSPDKARSAVVQGTFPLIALVTITIGFLS